MIPAPNRSLTDSLTRAQAWVLHAALVKHIERAIENGRTPVTAIAALEHIEGAKGPLDDAQRALLRDALVLYLLDAPERDRAAGRAVLDAIDSAPA